jgi:hypothetical protein
MAKKASSDAITTRIWLSEARALAVRAYGGERLAERRLLEWLGKGKVRWFCERFEGPRASDLADLQRKATGGAAWYLAPDVAYSDGDPAFWRADLEINWKENSAREHPAIVGGASAYGIEVAREDALAQLPEEPGELEELATAKEWIVEEARRMKRAGKIPDGITKTNFAKLIRDWMKKALRAGAVKKLVEWKYIRNELSDWDLWPISRI